MTNPDSRRNFLQGRFSSRQNLLRPPWALNEDDFLKACTRCGDCATACPTRIINNQDSGYPAISFADGECTFCGDCVMACVAGALVQMEGRRPWLVSAVIDDRCLAVRRVECRVCGDQCVAGAIRFPPRVGGVAVPVLDQALCSGCGACVGSCPSQAIRVE